MPPTPRPRPTVKRRMVSAFTEHLPLKFAALFFSLVLWFLVAGEESTAREMRVRFAVTTDSLVEVTSAVPEVHALIVGSVRDLLKLYASPPAVRRHIGSDSPEEVVFDIRPGDLDLPSGVSVRVQDVQPRTVRLEVEVRDARMVPVRSALRLVPPNGMRVAGPLRFEPESVQLSGLRARVRAVDSVSTTREELRVSDTATVVVLDTAGLGVRVAPTDVRVRVPLARVEGPIGAPAVDDTARVVPVDTASARDTVPDTRDTTQSTARAPRAARP